MNAPAIRAEWPGLDGSKYAGIAAGQDGQPDYHLVLLPVKATVTLSWQGAIAWAEKIGAALPTRDESALLYAHLRDEFEGGWHWTATQYDSYDAWGQNFYYGNQSVSHKKFEGRARAVRRLPLQSFGPLKDAEHTKPDTTNALLRQNLDELKGLRSDLRTVFLGDTGVEA